MSTSFCGIGSWLEYCSKIGQWLAILESRFKDSSGRSSFGLGPIHETFYHVIFEIINVIGSIVPLFLSPLRCCKLPIKVEFSAHVILKNFNIPVEAHMGKEVAHLNPHLTRMSLYDTHFYILIWPGVS